jgi:Protein of unknown function (DUF2797)
VADRLLAEGPLRGLSGVADDPVRYRLEVGDVEVDLNACIGRALRFDHLGLVTCRHCAVATRKRYGDGYCYRCFTRLARCDLCVMSPDRCHFAAGTCREPAWGQAFCMQPHLLYLANSAGVKVGITRPDNVPGRFIDQGASEALIVLTTATRHQAGLVEKAFGQLLREQTDWRALVSGEAPPADLDAVFLSTKQAVAASVDTIDRRFPGSLQWWPTPQRVRLRFPVTRYSATVRQLRLDPSDAVGGVLLGIKGSYLLFDQGVFNVRRHSSMHVRVVETTAAPVSSRDQLELFE